MSTAVYCVLWLFSPTRQIVLGLFDLCVEKDCSTIASCVPNNSLPREYTSSDGESSDDLNPCYGVCMPSNCAWEAW